MEYIQYPSIPEKINEIYLEKNAKILRSSSKSIEGNTNKIHQSYDS